MALRMIAIRKIINLCDRNLAYKLGLLDWYLINRFTMERTRRKLRNTDNCPEVVNVFNRNTGVPDLLQLLPQDLARKLTCRQKLTCNNVIELPELRPQGDIGETLSLCRQAGQHQQAWELSLLDRTSLSVDGEMAGPKEDPFIHPIEEEKTLSTTKRTTHEEMQAEEPREPRKDIWTDSLFLENLNSFLMSDYSLGKPLFSDSDFFSK